MGEELERRINDFSALQRAEIAEIANLSSVGRRADHFSALQRAEIAEIHSSCVFGRRDQAYFSALQRAEIAEIQRDGFDLARQREFQCSSTSRNC